MNRDDTADQRETGDALWHPGTEVTTGSSPPDEPEKLVPWIPVWKARFPVIEGTEDEST